MQELKPFDWVHQFLDPGLLDRVVEDWVVWRFWEYLEPSQAAFGISLNKSCKLFYHRKCRNRDLHILVSWRRRSSQNVVLLLGINFCGKFRLGLFGLLLDRRPRLGIRVWHWWFLLYPLFLLPLEESWVIKINRLHIIINNHRLLLLCRWLGLDFDVFDVLPDLFYLFSPWKVGGGLLDVRRLTGLVLEWRSNVLLVIRLSRLLGGKWWIHLWIHWLGDDRLYRRVLPIVWIRWLLVGIWRNKEIMRRRLVQCLIKLLGIFSRRGIWLVKKGLRWSVSWGLVTLVLVRVIHNKRLLFNYVMF